MVNKSNRYARRIAAAIALAALCACGGGGGGGGGAGPVGDPAPPVAAGLVPAAPPLGAVLLSDATQLRPLRNRALWTYRGRQLGGGSYTSRIDVTGDGPAFTEAGHRLGNGSDSSATVTIANGAVTVREPIDISLSGRPEDVTYVELRSPLRQGDQVTVFERSGIALGVDVDGDTIKDSGDVAAFSRVIGWEDIELPALSRTVRAVRVDTTVALRVTRSSDHKILPTLSSVQSVWYLPQVGVVRLQSTSASSTGAGPVDTDETLTGWDGITQGLGTLSPIDGRLTVNGVPSGIWVGRPLAAASMGDRALVVNALSSADDAISGVSVSMVSSRGITQTINNLPGLSTHNPVRMVRTSAGQAGLVWTRRDDTDRLGNPTRIRMVRFDAQGVPLDALPGRLVANGADGTEIATAFDGTAMWLMWTQHNPVSLIFELVARAFDAEGAPASPLVVLSEAARGGQVSPHLAAQAGRVIASWGQNLTFTGSPARFDVRVASFDASGLLRSSSLGITDYVVFEALDNANLTPLLTSGPPVVAWGAPVFTASSFGADLAPRGVALAADLTPILGSSGLPDDQRLAASALVRAPAALSTAVGNRVVFAQTAYNTRLLPQVPDDQLQLGFAVPSSPLTASSFSTLRWTARSEQTSEYFGRLEQIVALDDRVLLLGYQQSVGMMATIAWPN